MKRKMKLTTKDATIIPSTMCQKRSQLLGMESPGLTTNEKNANNPTKSIQFRNTVYLVALGIFEI